MEPLEKDLNSDDTATFLYIPGVVEMPAPAGMSLPLFSPKMWWWKCLLTLCCAGFEDYFGPGPHYRWMDDGGTSTESMQERVRSLPPGEDPESVMRGLKGLSVWNNRKEVFDYIGDALEKNPDIEGLIGYSEGSSVGAAYVLHEQDRFKEEGRLPRIKCSLFFTGWPPLNANGKLILKESDVRIDIPTIHVVGANGETNSFFFFFSDLFLVSPHFSNSFKL